MPESTKYLQGHERERVLCGVVLNCCVEAGMRGMPRGRCGHADKATVTLQHCSSASPHLPLLAEQAHKLCDGPVLEQVALYADAARVGCMQLRDSTGGGVSSGHCTGGRGQRG